MLSAAGGWIVPNIPIILAHKPIHEILLNVTKRFVSLDWHYYNVSLQLCWGGAERQWGESVKKKTTIKL